MRLTHTHRGVQIDTFLTDPPDDADDNHEFTWTADAELPNGAVQTICTDAPTREDALKAAETAIDKLVASWN